MGGFGSGRRQRYQRRTTEGYLALDIAVLRRRGLLQPGRSNADILVARRREDRVGEPVTSGIRSLRLSYNNLVGRFSRSRR